VTDSFTHSHKSIIFGEDYICCELNVFIFFVTVEISKSLGRSRVETIALLMHCSETEIFICFTGGKVFRIIHCVEFDKAKYHLQIIVFQDVGPYIMIDRNQHFSKIY